MAAYLLPALCLLTALGGCALMLRGIVMARAAHTVDVRVSRKDMQVRAGRGFSLPSLLAPHGRGREELVEKLAQAGFEGPHAAETFTKLRLGATLATLVLALLVCQIVWHHMLAKPLALYLAPAIVYMLGKRALGMLADRRQRLVIAEFPFLLDLMQMMLESGISLDQCFRTIARDEKGSIPCLNHTLLALVDDLDRGQAYDAALHRWALRVGLPGSKELASLFVQALFQGIELSPALRQFVHEFTERRVANAREAIGRLSVKMVLVMICFFMPALFIVVAGPPVTSLFDMIGVLKK